jgi:integrase
MNPDSNKYRLVHLVPKDICSDDLNHLCKYAGYSTKDLLLLDLPKIYVIVDFCGIPHLASTLFLLDQSLIGRGCTGDTARTYGESLLVWLQYLQQRNISMEESSEEHFGLYRSKLSTKLETLASATINLRLNVVVQFHLWGISSQIFSSPFGIFLKDMHIQQKSNGYVNSYRANRRLVPRVIRRHPRYVSANEWRGIMRLARQPFDLFFKWAVITGMRRFEVCNLKIQDLLPARQNRPSDDLYSFRILRKGGKEASIYAPLKLVDETLWYVDLSRPTPQSGYGDFVFLNNQGRGVSRASASVEFRRSADAVNSRATLHHLRHTYAVTLLDYLQKSMNDGDATNPLKMVQVLLGHSSIETTEIYLSTLSIGSKAVADSLAYLYGDRS